MKILPIKQDEKLLGKIDSLYMDIWNHSIKERLIKHSSYEGFRGYVIISDDEEVLGFSYGYTSLSGQYYHELLSKELEPKEYEKWLTDCFELVELAVHPARRKQGFGKFLVNELLRGVDNKTSLLTTQVSNHPARKMYENLGWVVVKESFLPNVDSSPYVIMGEVLK
ncbi:GNAT family N-acetyltransferase [Sutcliffiella cohnii]|uniref:GNAT family N-acetyltransferase n=1 Tax=Sutcliffiella cohnii TaxID=33932 RepID=UPI002E22FE97|nr:GNAT family N-acetyltransferase [Sutcliffiella cohnii]